MSSSMGSPLITACYGLDDCVCMGACVCVCVCVCHMAIFHTRPHFHTAVDRRILHHVGMLPFACLPLTGEVLPGESTLIVSCSSLVLYRHIRICIWGG